MASIQPLNVTVVTPQPIPGQDIYVPSVVEAIDNAAAPFWTQIFRPDKRNDSMTDTTALELLATGCQVEDRINCTAACLDSVRLFSSSATFFNCLALATTALFFQNGSTTIDVASLQAVDGMLSIGNLTAFNSPQVLESIAVCFASSCQDDNLGNCSTNPQQYFTETSVSGSDIGLNERLLILYKSLYSYCDGLNNDLNSDVAGPGVSVYRVVGPILFGLPSCSSAHSLFTLANRFSSRELTFA